MVLCSSHAAWVWNNELLSLSLLCFLLSWHSSTLVLGLCTAVCAPPPPLPMYPSLPLVPLPCSSHHLSVVYQDGFYSAADLYVSTLTSSPTHTCSSAPFPALQFLPVLLLSEWFCMLCLVKRCTEPPAQRHISPRFTNSAWLVNKLR